MQAGLLVLTLVGVFLWQANVERWCPFGGIEALYTYYAEGNMICSLGVSNFFVLGGVLLMTLLVRRAFCGYLCPIGTLSDWLGRLGRRLHVALPRVPPPVDRALSLLKYAALAAILYFTWRAGELILRGFGPCYALVGRHGPDITFWAYVTAGGAAAASLFWNMPFCRWLCPLAAAINPLSAVGLTRIKRDAQACNGCRKCDRACPMGIAVHAAPQVTAARCISCLECVDACPARDAGAIFWGPPRWLARRWPRGALAVILLLCTGGAVAASWLTPMPAFVRARPVARPAKLAPLELVIDDLTCRGRANLLYFFLDRPAEDPLHVPGYFQIEAWPGPGWSRVRISYDPTLTDAAAIHRAITEPSYAPQSGWRPSPFRIAGYDPLALP